MYTNFVLVFLTIISSVTAIENVDGIYDGYRLPNTTIPLRYDINLNVPIEALSGENTTFSGSVQIIFKVTESTNIIRLHSLVNILNVSLTFNGSLIDYTNYTTNRTDETLTIIVATTLSANVSYTLSINYYAILDPVNMKGFYRSEYLVNGTKEYLGISKFEPTYARQAFPCFDEPQFKVVIGLTITYPSGFTAVANTKVMNTSNSTLSTTTSFIDTPTISTYLLAFVVSKFTCSQNTSTIDDVLHRVCSRSALKSDRNLALNYGIEIINALGKWTNYSYSQMNLGKMDQFGLPDFGSGAMENWGLVTYREYMLLWNEEYTSNLYKQRILTVIAHEFAHMWFGDLVTTHWWNSIFLNEGFATYFEYFALNMVKDLSDFEIEKQFIIDQQQTAFVSDSSLNSSSLTSNVWTPAQIKNKFDTISYNKGASILRMVENFIGTTVFQKSLQNYIINNAYSTSNSEILWNSIGAEVFNRTLPNGLNLTQIMDNWTNYAGFPLVTATLNGTYIILTQKRFLYNGSDSTQWYVPITYKSSNSTHNGTIWLEPNSTVTLTNDLGNTGWIIINHNSTGYYRVHYDNTLRKRLANVLLNNHLQLSELDRTQLIDDAFNLARAGQIKYSETFKLLHYLKNETSYYPWYVTIRGMIYISTRFGTESVLGKSIATTLLEHIKNISADIATTNWTSIDHITSLKLQLIWNAACRFGQKKCISDSKRLFREFRFNNTSINPNIRDVVYCNALRYTDNITADWNFLWNRLNTIDQPHETLYILYGLGCARSRKHLLHYLDQSINSTSVIRIQDLVTVWSAVYSSSSVGLKAAFDHFTNNHTAILNHYSDAITVLSGIADRFTTDSELTQLQEFVNKQPANSTVGTTATLALESARQNLIWQRSVRKDIEDYFGISSSASVPSLAGSMCLLCFILFSFYIIN